MHSVVMNRGIFSCDLLHMWRIVLMFWHMIISKAVAVILTLVCQVLARDHSSPAPSQWLVTETR